MSGKSNLLSPIAWLAGAVLVAGAALAQDASYEVSARIQPMAGITDSTPVQLTIEVKGAGNPQVQAPALPKLTNLRVLGGPSQNTQHVWTPGRSTVSFQLIYSLLAEGPGSAEIPSIAIQVGDETYRTEPIRFEVEAASRASPRPRTIQRGGAEESEADVFLRARLGSDSVWVGQPVTLTVQLYTRQSISNPRWHEQPSFANFWVETLEVNPEAEAFRAKVDQRVYTVHPIERKVLVPPSPGEFEIEPFVAQMQVHRAGNDLLDFFNRSRAQTVIRKSDPLTLTVKPLPPDEPPGFSGAVGTYKLEATVDRDEVGVNDAVALTVSVSGEGSLRSVAPPIFDAPAELKIFDPKITETSGVSKGRLRSEKTWEWILVPLVPGEVRLPEIRFSFFDPEAGSYVELSEGDMTLAVLRGERAEDPAISRGDVRVQRRDLNFIKPLRGRLAMEQPRVHRRSAYMAGLLLPFGLAPLVIVLTRKRARLQRDTGLARSRRARVRARRRLQTARRHLERTDSESFHEEVARALVGYVADRFNRSATGLTYDLAEELLAARGVDPDLRRRFRSCLETCDFARFVPAAAKTERRAEVLDEAVALVEQMERAG